MDNRNNNSAVVPLTETDEVICAALIENVAWRRRVVRFSPHGDPTAELLNKLWAERLNELESELTKIRAFLKG